MSEHSLDVWGRSKELSRVAKYKTNVGPESRSQIERYVQRQCQGKLNTVTAIFSWLTLYALRTRVHDL